MTYEAEVRKVYPDARCSHTHSKTNDYDCWFILIDAYVLPLDFSLKSEDRAWELAYEALVKQNKIIK